MHDVMNLGRLLSDTARRLPDRAGLVWGDRQWTWRQLDERVNAAVATLKAQGFGKGDKLLVQARNSNQLFESMFVAFKLGAVWVPCNFRLTPPEVAFIAKSSEAVAMIVDDVFAGHVAAARAEAPRLRSVFWIGEAPAGESSFESLVDEGRGAAAWEADVGYDDACWFFFTSGTTGRPKAAVLTHGQMAYIVTNHLADLMPGTTEDDASLLVAPLSHGAGVHALPQVARGAKTVIPAGASFDEEEAWRLVERHRISNMFTVPTIVTRLCRHESVDRYDHSSLRFVIYAGAPMYRADQKHCLEKLGPVLVQYFGLGEVTGNITVLPAREHKPDYARTPVPQTMYVPSVY